MIKEEVKYNGIVTGYKLIINPKGIGIIQDVFDCDDMVSLVRITYKFKKNNDYKFNYINISDTILKFYHILDPYGFPNHIHHYPFHSVFKKGDKFEISTDDEIEIIELFMANKINKRNLNQNITYNNDYQPNRTGRSR